MAQKINAKSSKEGGIGCQWRMREKGLYLGHKQLIEFR